MRELHQVQKFVDLLADLVLRAPPDFEAERHVPPYGEVPERCVVLEAEADTALAHRHVRDVDAVDLDRAAIGRLEPGDDAQQGRFPPTARSEERGQRAGGDLEGHVVAGNSTSISLGDSADGDCHRRSLRW